MRLLAAAGGPRFAVYGLENDTGTPIYVHAKVCVVDDTWACVGSDNANRRSWSHDSELSCAALDTDPGPRGSWACTLRRELALEHLGDDAVAEDVADPIRAFDAFRASAQRLDAWHASGCQGPRPSGRLRTYTQPTLSRWTRMWATPMYRLMFDPDGRTHRMRGQGLY